MALIQWVQYNERVVGENSPIYPDDVDNRPLKQVFTASDLDFTADFPGFPAEYKGLGSPEGVQIAVPGQLYFQQDTPYALWVKQLNLDATGWAQVGGGVSGTPEYITKFTSAGNAIEDSIMYQSLAAGPPNVIIGLVDPFPTAGERLHTKGGIISEGVGADSVILGRGALAGGVGAVAIGTTSFGTGIGSVGIGSLANAGANGSVAVGISSISSGVNAIAIGGAASASASNTISIGHSASTFNSGAIAIGPSASAAQADGIAIGDTCTAGAPSSIAIGGSITIVAGASTGSIGINGQIGPLGAGTDLRASIVIGYQSFLNTPANYTDNHQSCIIIGPYNTRDVHLSSQPSGFDLIIGAGNVVNSVTGSTSQNNLIVGYNNNPGDASNNIICLGTGFVGSAQLGSLITIGFNTNHASNSSGNIMIGSGTLFTGGSGGQAILIGSSSSNQAGGGGGNVAIAIGFSARVDQDYCIAIGGSTRARSVASIVIGRNADSGFGLTDTMVIGAGAVALINNQVVIGGSNNGGDFREFIIGNVGESWVGAARDVKWRMTNANTAAGNNIDAGNLLIQAGLPSGNSVVGGEIQFMTGAPGASGGTLQTSTKQFAILKSAGTGPNTAWFNVTSGAAAQVGTLTNAPSAGNASVWLPVQINGATRYIPCWS